MALAAQTNDFPTAGPSRDSIPLYLINGVGTIWDAQIAATLHCEHGISGLRAGTLPGVSQQNTFLGLPMTLMQEETAYLVRSGIAHLVPVPSHPILPSPEQIKKHTQARIIRVRAQEERDRKALEQKAADARAAFEKGGEKARLKREARARAKEDKGKAAGRAESLFGGDAGSGERAPGVADGAASTVETGGSGSGATPDSISQPSSSSRQQTPNTGKKPKEPKTKESTSESPLIHGQFHIVPAKPHFPDLAFPSPPITTIPHPLFPFPSSARDNALLGVFTELHKRDYRMGLGPRFGGEYLVYPGDYLRYHAHFTSQVIVHDEPIKPTEIVAWGRLGTGTKKAGLICCWDDGLREEQIGEGGVEFYSLEWANFG